MLERENEGRENEWGEDVSRCGESSVLDSEDEEEGNVGGSGEGEEEESDGGELDACEAT